MTTPVGVSATSQFNASASVRKYTRTPRCSQLFFSQKMKQLTNVLKNGKSTRKKGSTASKKLRKKEIFCAQCTKF